MSCRRRPVPPAVLPLLLLLLVASMVLPPAAEGGFIFDKLRQSPVLSWLPKLAPATTTPATTTPATTTAATTTSQNGTTAQPKAMAGVHPSYKRCSFGYQLGLDRKCHKATSG